MGIRISKNVGLFIPIEAIDESQIKLIDEILDDEDLVTETLSNVLQKFSSSLSIYLGSVDISTISGYECFKKCFSYDDEIGYLISTPYQHSLNRHDENVDFYAPSQTITTINKLPYYDSSLEDSFFVSSDLDFYIEFTSQLNIPLDFLNKAYPAIIVTWG